MHYTNIFHIHLTEYLAYASLHSQMLQRGSCFCKTKQKQFNHKSSGKLQLKKNNNLKLFQSKSNIYYYITHSQLSQTSELQKFLIKHKRSAFFFHFSLVSLSFLGLLQGQIQLNQPKYFIGS